MTFAQLINILKARWILIATIIATLLALALAYSFLAPKTYVAETELVVNGGELSAVTGMPQSLTPQFGFIATQADIIVSHGVATKVVDQLNLVSDSGFQHIFQEETGGVGSPRDWIASQLIRSIEVKRGRESNVLTIISSSTTPFVAEQLANAFAEAYVSTVVDIKAQNATKQALWLDRQVDAQRVELEQAQKKLAQYQQEAGIAGSEGRMDEESLQLTQLAGQLAEAQSARSDADSRLGQVRQAATKDRQDAIPQLANDPVVQGIKASLNAAEAKLAEAGQRFGRKHPQYLAASSEVEKLTSRLDDALRTAQMGIQESAQQAKLREEKIGAALNAQRQRILSLQQETNQQDVLTRDVESAQRAYDLASQRAKQMALEGRLDQSSVAVLSPAALPVFPSAPRPLLNSMAAIVLGGLVGITLAFLLELKNGRVRSEFDLTQLGLPVLCEVGRLNRPRRRRSRRSRQKILEANLVERSAT